MSDFYITVEREPGKPKDVHGPFSTYLEAYSVGESVADQGKVEMHRADLVCDFCSEPEVKWSYPAHDIVSPDLEWASAGEWAACEICHALIESGDRDALAERSMQNFIRFNNVPDFDPEIRSAIKAGIRQLHDTFFIARTGEAEKETRPI